MEFSLSSEEKQSLKNIAKSKLQKEIYLLAISSSIDPETLSVVDGKVDFLPDETLSNTFIYEQQTRLRAALDAYESLLSLG